MRVTLLFFAVAAFSCLVLSEAKKNKEDKIKGKCNKELVKIEGTDKRVPQCTKSGKYEVRQCDGEKCWCVKSKSGKTLYKQFRIPVNEEFDCKRKPTDCEESRFNALLKNAEDPDAPLCDEDGNEVEKPKEPEFVDPCNKDQIASTCENLALGRRTFQSSVYGGYAVSGKAVDGNTDGNWNVKSTACTNSEKNPWFVVDLGAARNVYRVDITNRKDCCADRLNNLHIGVTNTSPESSVPNLSNFDECATFEGSFAAGATKPFPCNKKGRYVVIQMETNAQYLTMAEVQVYGEKLPAELKLEASIPEGCRASSLDDSCENIAIGKSTAQSSIYGGYAVAARAIDGNSNGLWSAASCACTNADTNPWWSVDMGAERQVYSVEITNRKDCCADRLTNVIIGTSNNAPTSETPNLENFDVCYRYYGKFGAGEAKAFPCLTKGRYLIIQSEQKQYLTMCEVRVFAETVKEDKDDFALPEGCTMDIEDPTCENVAIGKRAFQSSTYQGYAVASRAIDGNTDGNWNMGSVACTNTEQNPWWAVDLQESRMVYRVDIWNRKDCCPDRLRHIRVGVSDTSPEEVKPDLTNFQVCGVSDELIGAGARRGFACGERGRYLIVQLENKQFLTMAEVKVYGELTSDEKKFINKIPEACRGDEMGDSCTNIAKGKATLQSSIYGNYALASLAVDGNTDGNWGGKSCACTNSEKNPWWSVDLGAEKLVYRVEITNRKDCCHPRLRNVNIGLTNVNPANQKPALDFDVCATDYSGKIGAGETRGFQCRGRGRFVVVQLEATEYLTMCEVQVYGVDV